MQFVFNKDLYSKNSLLKAAYTFIDDYYLHLDVNEREYIVDLFPKDKSANLSISEEEFLNEVLIQETREIVWNKTHTLREIIYGRAMASTIIDVLPENDLSTNLDSDSILKDWFDDK